MRHLEKNIKIGYNIPNFETHTDKTRYITQKSHSEERGSPSLHHYYTNFENHTTAAFQAP